MRATRTSTGAVISTTVTLPNFRIASPMASREQFTATTLPAARSLSIERPMP